MKKASLAHLAQPGATINVRVTPRASRNKIEPSEDGLKVWVTCVPEDGKATKAVIALVAKALGIAKSNLALVRGATSRDKVFRVL